MLSFDHLRQSTFAACDLDISRNLSRRKCPSASVKMPEYISLGNILEKNRFTLHRFSDKLIRNINVLLMTVDVIVREKFDRKSTVTAK